MKHVYLQAFKKSDNTHIGIKVSHEENTLV